MWVLLSIALHKGTSVHLPPPSPDYWYKPLFFVADPGPLPEIAVSAFSRSLLGRAIIFSFLYFLLTPRILRIYLSVLPLSPCFLALVFLFSLSFLLVVSCNPKTSLWTYFFLDSSCTLPYMDCAIPSYPRSPFLYFFHITLSAMAGTLLLLVPYFLFPSQLAHVLICVNRAHSQFALYTIVDQGQGLPCYSLGAAWYNKCEVGRR